MVAFTALLVLFGIAGSVLSTYLTAGTTVTASYSSADQLLPSSIIMQRLLRSEVEPAPTLTSTVTGIPAGYCANPTANVPCPGFKTGAVGSYSVTFFANVGAINGQNYGPAEIVMAEGTPTQCTGCKFATAQFTVTEYPAANSTCPFSLTATNVCSWSSSGIRLVTINNVVNGQTLSGGTVVLTTPIFTYNTLDLDPTNATPPLPATYTPTAGGTATATPAGAPTGVYPTFSTCSAPTFDSNNLPVTSHCPPDIIQSVHVDIQVHTQGSAVQENSFTVFRLSSNSFLYSPLVG
jgi:hypothetical protein